MTGTAETEAEEFGKIYSLDVNVIPPNKILRRLEEPDAIYKTEREKSDAIVADIIEKQELGRPVLVGTICIEKSERSRPCSPVPTDRARGPQRQVPRRRNAKIVAQAGRKSVCWNDHRDEHGRSRHRHPARRQPECIGAPAMPGRRECRAASKGRGAVSSKTNIRVLLPPDAFYGPRGPLGHASSSAASPRRTPSTRRLSALGGLHIVGTERHEARRIDNQLRADPAGRVTPAPPGSTSRSKTT